MDCFLNIKPKNFTTTAIIIGYILIEELNTNEQNILGNWLMLVSQVISSNAIFEATQNSNQNTIIPKKDINNNEQIKILTKMINAINKEIEELKKKL